RLGGKELVDGRGGGRACGRLGGEPDRQASRQSGACGERAARQETAAREGWDRRERRERGHGKPPVGRRGTKACRAPPSYPSRRVPAIDFSPGKGEEAAREPRGRPKAVSRRSERGSRSSLRRPQRRGPPPRRRAECFLSTRARSARPRDVSGRAPESGAREPARARLLLSSAVR